MYIVIPSYEPDLRLVKLIKDINENFQAKIIVVNDGSDEKYDEIFNQCRELNALVLAYKENQGKGYALKKAFKLIKESIIDNEVIVCVDSDGQHLVEDIKKVALKSSENPNDIVLGVRSFVGKVPFRSIFGNKITAFIFKIVTGVSIKDTQTGLRAFSKNALDFLIAIEGDRFEYEFNVLLKAKENNHNLLQVDIETVYIEENKSSHFRPLVDSYRIYKPILKFISTSFMATLLDNLIFIILNMLITGLFLPLVISRVCSSLFQWFLNGKLVFNKNTNLKSMFKFFVLVICLFILNYLLIEFLVRLGVNELFAKIAVETLVFILSYRYQKSFVYN